MSELHTIVAMSGRYPLLKDFQMMWNTVQFLQQLSFLMLLKYNMWILVVWCDVLAVLSVSQSASSIKPDLSTQLFLDFVQIYLRESTRWRRRTSSWSQKTRFLVNTSRIWWPPAVFSKARRPRPRKSSVIFSYLFSLQWSVVNCVEFLFIFICFHLNPLPSAVADVPTPILSLIHIWRCRRRG